jgi:peptidoglycan L-alanyl-D-glutamate endopeptidase CwlK
LELLITSGYRNFQEQALIFAKGRKMPEGTVIDRKKVVTNARPGESWHNYGLALDFVPIVAGKPVWVEEEFELYGIEAEKYGLEWGGRWKRPDRPHLQKLYNLPRSQRGSPTPELKAILGVNQVVKVWDMINIHE